MKIQHNPPRSRLLQARPLHARPLLAATVATALLAACVVTLPNAAAASPTDAPGAPGMTASWTSGNKQGMGTAAASDAKPSTLDSTVWFTLGQGTTTEVFYPTVDRPQVQDLQYIVTDGSTRTSVERDDTTHVIELVDKRSLEYRQVDTAKDGSYRLTKTYVTDPARASLLISTRFEQLTGTTPLHLYALFNPSTGGDGDTNTAATRSGMLVSSGSGSSSALGASIPFSRTTSGYSGTASDPFTQLATAHALTTAYDTAPTLGNVVQAAEIPVGRDTSFTLALSFGASESTAVSTAVSSLVDGFANRETLYGAGWHDWLASLLPPPTSVTGPVVAGSPDLLTQYNVSLMTLKAHEDKTYRGAYAASLSVPWGQSQHGTSPGYHAVWARDLYNMATALLAAGDTAAANRALDYLLKTQERADGSLPHNTMVDGRAVPGLDGLQFDEIADPAILAVQLNRTDPATWAKVKLSADYLLAHGPSTPQERWEEQSGFSPSTIAAEVAGLVSAAQIATANRDDVSAKRYLDTADLWQASVESWTVTHTGSIATAHYERIDPQGTPDSGTSVCDTNGAGCLDARELVDGGFLDLVRLGVKAPGDAVIRDSVAVVDSLLKVSTPSGTMWRRYNKDGYGEHADGSPYVGGGGGIGRPWPVLAGERGEYELANGRDAMPYLVSMAKTANAGFMIPEQVWDAADLGSFTAGEATDSAASLAWAQAQFVRLAVSIGAGHNVETPIGVLSRYQTRVNVTFAETAPTTWGENIYVVGNTASLGNWDPAKAIRLTSAGYPTWSARVSLPAGSTISYKFIRKAADGKVTWEVDPDHTVTLPVSGDATYASSWK